MVGAGKFDKTKETLSKIQKAIRILKNEVRLSLKWRQLLKMKSTKTNKNKSAFEMFSIMRRKLYLNN